MSASALARVTRPAWAVSPAVQRWASKKAGGAGSTGASSASDEKSGDKVVEPAAKPTVELGKAPEDKVATPAKKTAADDQAPRSEGATAESSAGPATGATGASSGATVDKSSRSTATPPPRSTVLVLGGNGFVGTSILQAALKRGFQVAALSRSGRPKRRAEDWMDHVEWIEADALEPDSYRSKLLAAQSVVSCIGGFGSSEYMLKVNGEATVRAVRASAESGVERFVFISAKRYHLVEQVGPMRAYFAGKRAAEAEVQSLYPTQGAILRPGFIYGTKYLGSTQVPLQLVGMPLEMVASLTPFRYLSKLPLFDLTLSRPVSVQSVASCALRAAVGEETQTVLEIDDIAGAK